MKEIISMIAGGIFLLSFIPYIKGIIKKENKPMVSSWFIWVTLDWITGLAMMDKGVLNWLMIAALTGGTTTLVLAFIYGDRKLSKMDYYCLLMAFIGILLWYKVDSIYAIIISQITMLVGSLPTILSVYKEPSNESKVAWMINFISCLLQVFALKSMKLEEVLQPLNFLLIQGVMVYLLWVPRKQKE